MARPGPNPAAGRPAEGPPRALLTKVEARVEALQTTLQQPSVSNSDLTRVVEMRQAALTRFRGQELPLSRGYKQRLRAARAQLRRNRSAVRSQEIRLRCAIVVAAVFWFFRRYWRWLLFLVFLAGSVWALITWWDETLAFIAKVVSSITTTVAPDPPPSDGNGVQ